MPTRIFKFFLRPAKTPIRSVRRKACLLGEEYPIRLEEGARNSAKIKEGVLCITLKEMTRETFEEFYASWYRRASRKILVESIERWRVRLELMGYDVPMPQIKIYRMNRAWGRCYYTKNVITFNSLLPSAPQRCVDCITLHELCHMLIHTHDPHFYGIMTRVEPAWREWEADLKAFAKQKGYTR